MLGRLGTLRLGDSTALGTLSSLRWEQHGAGGHCEGDHLGGGNEMGVDTLFEVGCNWSMSEGSLRDQAAGVEWQQKQCK